MFHAHDGLFFEQQPDGAVRILIRESGQVGAPVLREYQLDCDSWASVIATMSYYGEEDNGFYRAGRFHNGIQKRDAAELALKDKPPKWTTK